MSVDVTRVSVEVQRKRKSEASRLQAMVVPGGPADGPADGHEEAKPVEFVQAPHEGLTSQQAAQLLEQWGKNELPEKITPKWLIFCRLLTGPMPIVLWLAAIIEVVIGNYADMAILLVIQFVNAGISFYETTKAGDAVAALKNSLKPTATVKRDGKWADIDATLLVPGDLVLLAAGSAVPADSYVNEGLIEVDQSAMTGESLPVKFRRGDVCKLGSTVVRGETEGTVESTGAHTFFGKTASMLQASGQAVSSLQILLMRIMIILVTLSVTLCIIALIYLIVEGRKANALKPKNLQHSDNEIVRHSLSFAVCVLVASIPLAIEIVTTCTLAMGAKQLSTKGAIVTRLAAIEEMAGMDMLCSDKTGTLTLNKVPLHFFPPSAPSPAPPSPSPLARVGG
jgi:H+-transporting ATPase